MYNPEEKSFTLTLPEQEDLDKITFDKKNIQEFVKLAYPISSDRTLVSIVDIAKVVKVVWGMDEEDALCKTAQLMFPSIEGELTKKISNPDKVAFRDALNTLKSEKTVNNIINQLSKLASIGERLAKGDQSKVKQYEETVKQTVMSSGNQVLIDKYYQLNNAIEQDVMDLLGA